MKKSLLLCLFSALFAQSVSAEDEGLAGFSLICTLDESCAVEASSLVAFGLNGRYVYKTLSGNFLCAPQTFATSPKDASKNGQCYVLDGVLSRSSNVSSEGQTASQASEVAPLRDGDYALISRSSGKALSVRANDAKDGAKVIETNFAGDDHQKWRITLLDNGFYSIKALHSEKALESVNLDSKDGSSLKQQTWMNGWSQHWLIEAADDGFVKIISRANGQALDAYDIVHQAEDGVLLWTYWGGENQQWKLVPLNEKDAANEAQVFP